MELVERRKVIRTELFGVFARRAERFVDPESLAFSVKWLATSVSTVVIALSPRLSDVRLLITLT